MNNYREIMDRLKLFFNVNSDRKVAEKLGINYNTIKTWSNRGKIPLEKILSRLQNETINIDWLLTGRGEMFLKEAAQNINNQDGIVIANSSPINGNITISTNTHNKKVTQKEDELLEAYRKLPPKRQQYYYHKILSDAIEYELKDENNSHSNHL